MSGTIQCPQCGAASSAKVSETEYHCIYCESNFMVGMSKEEMIANILKKAGVNQRSTPLKFDRLTGEATGFNQEKLAQMREQATVNIATAKKAARRVGLIILIVVFGILGIVIYSINKVASGVNAIVNNVIANSTVSKFTVFSGSKGPVIWLLQEQSVSMHDSTHYILSIIDPPTKKHFVDLEYIPAMTWSDAFDSRKFIGDFYAFGDTCWIISEQYGLTARDIYTGKIIIDAQKLCKMHTELQKGITKAEWGYSDRYFSIMTNDGFEFIFLPDQNKIIKKEDFDNHKRDESNMVTRNFFVLSESKRPGLYLSVENTSPFATSSKTYSGELEKTSPDYKVRDVISVTHVLPDLIFFNGYILFSDNNKAIIAYQNTIAKNSALHFSCVDSNGKLLWNVSGKDSKPFEKDFSDNNRAVDYVGSKNVAVLYTNYGDHDVIGIDRNTGKVLWQFTTKKTDK